MHQDCQCTFCLAVGHQIAAPPRDKNYKRTGTIAAYVLFVLTVYPKKGGNIQVATKVLELLAPVKMHFLSLARALSAMEDGKEACFISDKMGCIIQKINILCWRVQCYICQKPSHSVHTKALWGCDNVVWDLNHLQSFRLAMLYFRTRSELSLTSVIINPVISRNNVLLWFSREG